MSNTRSDWPTLRKKYVEGDTTLRALAIANDIPTSSLINRSKHDGWQEDREKFRNGVAVKGLQALIDHQAEELVSARGEAIDALRKGLARFVSDLARTHRKKVVTSLNEEGDADGWEIIEEPVITVMPKDLAILIDKVNILSGQPANITRTETEGRVDISGSIEGLSADVLAALADAARTRLPDTGAVGGSTLPRIADPDPAGDGA